MNANLIPELPFKFTIDPNYTFTVINQGFDDSGWVMYDVVRDYDELNHIVSAVTLMTKLKSGEWKIVKEEKYMNKMPKLVAGKHWVVVENGGYGGIGLTTINNMIHYIKGEDGTLSTGYDSVEDVSEYVVEVREIADDTPPTFRYAKTVWKKVDQKQLAIQKELEFAKAKADRLAAHISVLETKLKQ